VFRTSQRNVEKEFGPLQHASDVLVSQAQVGALTTEEALKSVDGMIGRVESLKRKVRQAIQCCLTHFPLISAPWYCAFLPSIMQHETIAL